AEMITFFTGPRMCLRASAPLVKRPVDSTTIWAPTEDQSISAGSLTRKTLKLLPSTEMLSSVWVTLFERLPRIESYFSRCASVFESVMSLTATISMAGSPRAARKILRPMRPNPLIPTLTAMLPPENYREQTAGEKSQLDFHGKSDARVRAEKSQRGFAAMPLSCTPSRE